MDFSEKEDAILQILSNQYFLEYEGQEYLYIEPQGLLKLRAGRRAKAYFKDLDTSAFFTEEERLEFLAEHQIWVPSDEESLKQLNENYDKLSGDRELYRYRSNQLKQLDDYIQITKDEMEVLTRRKGTLATLTIEFQLRQYEYSYLLAHSLYDINNDLVWATFDDFEEDTDYVFFTHFLNIAFFKGVFSEQQIREIARSEPWRTRWKTGSKLKLPLFNDDLTSTQFRLCYWSNLYDAVFESMDCPDDEVINNDEQLDLWFEEQSRKAKERRQKKDNKGSKITNPKIASAQEVFVPVDSRQDAQKVYKELNSPQARKIFRNRQQEIYQKKTVKEQNFSDTQQELRMQVTRMHSENVKRKRK